MKITQRVTEPIQRVLPILIGAAFVFAAVTPNSATWAAEPAPAASEEPQYKAEDYGRICGNVLSTPQTPGVPPDSKRQYCQAAKQANESAKGEDMAWKAWAAVAGVCVAACATSYIAPIGSAGSTVCNAGAVGAVALDYVVTKDLMGSMTVLSGMMMSSMMKGPAPAADAAAAAKKEPSKDMGPCIVGATAAMQAASRNSAMKNHQKAVSTNLASAASVGGLGTAVRSAATAGDTSAGPGGANISSGSMGVRTGSGSGDSSSSDINSGSPTCGTSGLAIMQCAIAVDRNIPQAAGTPQFAEHFKNTAGLDLSDFMNKASSPKQGIMAAAGGALNTEQLGHLHAALEKMEAGLGVSVASSAYSSGGGGGGSHKGSDGGDDMMAQMMSQMMGQMGGGQGPADDPQKGLRLVIFANQKKTGAAIAEDRTLNIFDRVTFRYHYATLSMMREEGRR